MCVSVDMSKNIRVGRSKKKFYLFFLALLVETSQAYAIPRCPSVNNYCYPISSEAIYHRDLVIVPVCWPNGVVVHLQF